MHNQVCGPRPAAISQQSCLAVQYKKVADPWASILKMYYALELPI